MFTNNAWTRELLHGDSAPPTSDHQAPPSRIFDPYTYNLVTTISPPHFFFTPLGFSIFNCASLVQCFLVSDCSYDPFDLLDQFRMNGPRPSRGWSPTPQFYCFATLMFFAGWHPYHLIIVLPIYTLHVILLLHPFVTAQTFQTPLALKALFID